ncbi:MAG TPA: molybdenum cofactor biosynthesis protein MoaE [Candidatus Polarisedimenticolia bacterium]|nr:molybdenum cofactor biosynthesis protein MoaE [Candidatus Polarisedimenticolia bacterium]
MSAAEGRPGDIVRVGPEPIDAGVLAAALRTDASGAIASFAGVVRDHHQGRRVSHLIYEAYPPMAESELRRIVDEARGRWPVQRMAIVHRTGRLAVGETSVAVVVACAHRRAALEACSFAIEELKRSVPIWKKEFSDTGEEWILGDPSSPC